jgi:PIN domain nuclease of toxin-antitoxin system
VKVLLDTHSLLWWLTDDDQLGTQARDLIADPGNDILVSVASLWEIVIKVRVGKLEADIEDISKAIELGGFILLAISPLHLRTLVTLPNHHRDPFDHLLIAQAISEKAIFLSEDQNTLKYPVQTIRCSNATPTHEEN